MRERREPQATMLAFVDLEERVPRNHPLRVIQQHADRALNELSPVFDQMYAAVDHALDLLLDHLGVSAAA